MIKNIAIFTFVTILGLLSSFWGYTQILPELQVTDALSNQPLNMRYVTFLPEPDLPIEQNFTVLDKATKNFDEVTLTIDKQLDVDTKAVQYVLEAKYILGQGLTNRKTKFWCNDYAPIESSIEVNPEGRLMSIYTEYKFDNARVTKKTEKFQQSRNISCPKKAIDHNSLFYLARCFDVDQLKEPAYLFVVYSQKNNSFLTQVKFEGYKTFITTDDCCVFSVDYGEFKEYYWQQKESPWLLVKAITEFEEWTAIL